MHPRHAADARQAIAPHSGVPLRSEVPRTKPRVLLSAWTRQTLNRIWLAHDCVAQVPNVPRRECPTKSGSQDCAGTALPRDRSRLPERAAEQPRMHPRNGPRPLLARAALPLRRAVHSAWMPPTGGSVAARALGEQSGKDSRFPGLVGLRPQDEVDGFLCQRLLRRYNNPAPNQLSHSFVLPQHLFGRDKGRYGNATVRDNNALSPLNLPEERTQLGFSDRNRSITHLTIIVISSTLCYPTTPVVDCIPNTARIGHHPPRLAQEYVLRTAYRPIARRSLRVGPTSRKIPRLAVVTQAD